jgi:diaminohydroxyphosphoribosylaminopyrimidine deaminase/5-amino-6-(5-phosphoribosylamino)uracil reductase
MDTSPIATFALEPDPPRDPAGGSVGLGSAGADPGESLDEARLAALLVELAAEASALRFEVAPNPCVGAAILSRGEVIGRGVHRVWGGAHAEVEALAAAERSGVPREAWDLALVTLEPCSSSGKTPPCVEALVRAGIPRVVVGELDPDPRHRGAGLEALRARGVEVFRLDGVVPLERVSPHFLRWTAPERLRRPRPWTIAKWAQTRTGQLQPPEDVGGGRWITGGAAQVEVHELRGRVDAVVTGVGTVLADDPRLTVRPPARAQHAPRRVILDSYLRTPPDAALFEPAAEGELAGPVLILTVAGADAARWRALEAAGAEVRGLHTEDGHRLDLREAQEVLWELGVRRALLECGPTLLQAALEREFVDQVRVYTGDVNGGRGPSMAGWFAEARLEGRLDRECGPDAVLEAFTG